MRVELLSDVIFICSINCIACIYHIEIELTELNCCYLFSLRLYYIKCLYKIHTCRSVRSIGPCLCFDLIIGQKLIFSNLNWNFRSLAWLRQYLSNRGICFIKSGVIVVQKLPIVLCIFKSKLTKFSKDKKLMDILTHK